MKRENFTAERVAGFKCETGKKQSIYWDGKTPGLGLRVTAADSKAFIFETRLNGKTIRMTIGDPRNWAIGKAQAEASRLKVMTDQGIDPRQVIADSIAAKEAEAASQREQEARETVTVADAWKVYIAARKPFWGAHHYADHEEVMQPGGRQRKRSKMLTEPGALASLANVRLIDLTPERVTEWAKVEGEKRPGRARLANRLLTVFLTWCIEHPTYREIVTRNPAKNKAARELLGKPQRIDDTLQREQLPSWFNAVGQLGNPILSAYLQTLLLTGARPNELTALRWEDADFQWGSLTIRDKIEGLRVIPLPPYLGQLLNGLPRRNEWVFSSVGAKNGHLTDPHPANYRVCAATGLNVSLYGLRRSFASLCEWIETPAGIAAQIQGHKPSGVREKHYIRRPLDLLRMWHVKIEEWILNEAGIKFVPVKAGLRAVN